MRIADILRSKGSAVATVTATTTVTGLLAELTVHNVGAMVVIGTGDRGMGPGGQERSDRGMGAGGVIGIVSERDIVRRLHTVGPDLLRRPVADIMSDVAVTCRPEDPVDDLAALMTNNRVRHVPVLDDGRLVGIVSIGDVVKIRMEELQAERQQLRAYITQGG
jgi:CBS domain-containing protein